MASINNNHGGASISGGLAVYNPNHGAVGIGAGPNSIFPQGGIGMGAGLAVQNNIQVRQRTPWTLPSQFPTHLFKPGDPVYSGLTTQSNDFVHFYLSLWIACEQVDPMSYGVVESNDAVNPATFSHERNITILFANQDDAERFNRWHERYAVRFGSDTWCTRYFPSISSGMHVNGYAYPTSVNIDSVKAIASELGTTTAFDEWKWIVQNTYDKVLFVNGFWIFENESEMVMFKMRDKE